MKKLNVLAQKGKINENASIRDSHSTIINASIEKVWSILTHVDKWPEWNSEIKKIDLNGELKEGCTFTWKYGRTQGQSEIQKIDKPNTFAWTSKAKWVKRIFVWSLESDENQTIVTVSASLQGRLVVFMENHQKVYDELLNWLESLKIKSGDE